jgi:hypothetical protein
MDKFSKLQSVTPLERKRLLVTFDNGIRKIYDCSPLLEEETFGPLIDEFLIKQVRIDDGGYGISWNDEIDLSESELWLHGSTVETKVGISVSVQ